MERAMGPFPKEKIKPSLDIRIVEHLDTETISRMKMTYLSEEGDHTPGYVLKPKKLRARVAGILCLHQTTPLGAAEPAGLGGNPNLRYAQELAERGYVTFAPDYPDLPFSTGFGGYHFDAYRQGYQSQTMKGIWNHVRAVDLLQSMPEVDPQRIGCIGHSLGGHNTLFVGAFDQRIRVLVSSCGFTSFRNYYGGELSGWAQERYMPLIALRYHNNPSEMPFDFPDILAALAPRPLFVNAPLHDANFDVTGVRDTMKVVRSLYSDRFSADAKLVVRHPNAAHSFPPAVRNEAYQFIDKWPLRDQPS
jgi:dienelactone hydrolase